ncbi:MAG: sigma-54 dependent transcriptional regulator, partial [Planctomycetota bacterium]
MSAVNRPDPGTSLLLVDDERPLREAIADYFRELGYRVETAGDLGSARERLRDARFDVVLCDVFLPDGDGTDLVAETAREAPDTAVILLTGYGSIESAVAAVRAGAFDYLTKPIVDEELAIAVSRAVERHRIVVENRQLKKQLDEKYGLGTIVGRDYKMQRMFDLLESVADTRTSVLILGESGTGKTMTARALHHLSDRRDAPFVEVACGALPEGLLESELFGHVKGAFTGATTDRPGKFLQADGGTLFLDEIATAPQSLQVKLLRVIQDREFEAVGGTKTHKVDVRLVFATNADLAEMVKAGEFREDLYYR